MRRDLLAAAVACALAGGATASAEIEVTNSSGQIINGQSNDTAPTSALQTGWNNTGEEVDFADQQLNASATYIGNGWVLTDEHVGDGDSVTFDGGATYYTWNGVNATILTNTDNSTSDLLLYKLTGIPAGVSNISLTSSEPALNTTFYSFGYGLSRDNSGAQYYNVTGTPTDYTWTPSSSSSANEILYQEDIGVGSKLWGTNIVYQTTTKEYNGIGYIDGFNSAFNLAGTEAPSATTSQEIATGDSGGGVYNTSGQLIGINDFSTTFSNQPEQSNGYDTETAAYGDTSGYNDIYDYLSQIESVTGVPEPASVSVLLLGLGAVTLRRRRKT